MSEVYRTIRRPVLTEKSTARSERLGEYVFEVHPRANKIEIRQAVEALYDVKVLRVNTSTKKGLKRRVGWGWTTGSSVKKAVVKLREGDRIDLI